MPYFYRSGVFLIIILSFSALQFFCQGERLKEQKEITIMLPGDIPLKLVRIESGQFMMGSPESEPGHEPDEKPYHEVNIGYEFFVGRYEVTQAQWFAVIGSWPDSSKQPNPNEGLGDTYPAYFVSWYDAQRFLTALNQHIIDSGQGQARYRLPSEAEWEYACRAGTQTRFSFGDSLLLADGTSPGDYMWYKKNAKKQGPKPVGTKLPNQFGLYDMHGNVWEWCQDWYHDSYNGAPTDGSPWEKPIAEFRILHGGDWENEANTCRSANRNDHRGPDARSADIGFRIVRTIDKN